MTHIIDDIRNFLPPVSEGVRQIQEHAERRAAAEWEIARKQYRHHRIALYIEERAKRKTRQHTSTAIYEARQYEATTKALLEGLGRDAA